MKTNACRASAPFKAEKRIPEKKAHKSTFTHDTNSSHRYSHVCAPFPPRRSNKFHSNFMATTQRQPPTHTSKTASPESYIVLATRVPLFFWRITRVGTKARCVTGVEILVWDRCCLIQMLFFFWRGASLGLRPPPQARIAKQTELRAGK